ncbi:macrolide export ATP-binding/permease protein MacB [bacterium MnTg02]|nr:macrolide export ATP-binding/permease protein MacB [bacterium MnTg02]
MSVSLAEFDDVSLTLPSRAGPVDILRGISLDVTPGEAIGIVGPSGSGKTTLLMVMGGLEYATSGYVRVVGENLSELSEDALARLRGQHIGIVFQSFHLIPTMTARENVALPLEFLGKSEPFSVADEALADVGLSHRLDHFPAQLSGGEQQRVALARALAPRPKLLLADEPTGNLDAQTGAQVMDLIFDLQDRHGATLVLVTHDQALTARCKRIVRMQDGRIISADATDGSEASLLS